MRMRQATGNMSRWWWGVVAIAAGAVSAAGEPRDLGKRFPVGVQKPVVTDARQLAGALAPTTPLAKDRWQATSARSRGAALAVYPTVAPATVVVRSGRGHGTGFIIEPDGWILTNHHVVQDATVDKRSQVPTVIVHLGRLQDGFMTLIDEEFPAEVYKVSEEKDLALLKLKALPAGMDRLPCVKLATEAAKPGADCVAIGHPARGMLWTVRSGEVSSVGTWPEDMIDVVMERLCLTAKDRSQLQAVCAKAGKRKVLISSCGLNPGDSGGPLVNDRSELIAVSFAIPSSDEGSSVSLDKFSYHVHLDEIRAFLAERPQTPAAPAMDPWPAAARFALHDFDDDGIPDLLVFAVGLKGTVTGLLVDLDQDSGLREKDAVPQGNIRELWDFELALHQEPEPRAFYDTDNDGQVDLVLIDEDDDDEVDVELHLEGGQWKSVKPSGTDLVDPLRFASKRLQKRAKEFLIAVTK